MMARCSSDGESSRRTSGRVDHAELRSSSTGNLVRRLVGLHGAAGQLPAVLVVGSTSMVRSPCVKHLLPDPWSELGVNDLVERLPPSMVA